MTTAARPVDVVMIPICLNRGAVILDEQMRASRKETWFLDEADGVVFAAQMASLTADAQRDGVLGSFITLKRIDELQELPRIDRRGMLRGVPEFRMALRQIFGDPEVQRVRGVPADRMGNP